MCKASEITLFICTILSFHLLIALHVLHICAAAQYFLKLALMCVLTRQVTAEYLHPHANPSWGPPLWKHSDVLGHYLIKSPHLWGIIVAVPLKNLKQRDKHKNDDSQ